MVEGSKHSAAFFARMKLLPAVAEKTTNNGDGLRRAGLPVE